MSDSEIYRFLHIPATSQLMVFSTRGLWIFNFNPMIKQKIADCIVKFFSFDTYIVGVSKINDNSILIIDEEKNPYVCNLKDKISLKKLILQGSLSKI